MCTILLLTMSCQTHPIFIATEPILHKKYQNTKREKYSKREIRKSSELTNPLNQFQLPVNLCQDWWKLCNLLKSEMNFKKSALSYWCFPRLVKVTTLSSFFTLISFIVILNQHEHLHRRFSPSCTSS